MGNMCNEGLNPFNLPIGPTGNDGADGGQGLTGLSFRFGNGVPAQSLGIDGDSYVDLTSTDLDVYTKASGSWTDSGQNLRGTTGATGDGGTLWTSGSGSPVGTLAAIGTFYFNEDNGDIWRVQPNGTFLLLFSTAGATGAQGLSLRVSTGVPVQSLGVDGDSYIDIASPLLDLYTKSSGVWINSGIDIKGDPGADGADGLSFIQGTGVPAQALGNNGDTYLDNANNDIYVKATGAWALTGNISVGSLANQFRFRAQNSADFAVPAGPGNRLVQFNDDSSAGFFDNGNTFATDRHIVPQALSQRFIVEQLSCSTNLSQGNFVIGVYVNGTLNTSVSQILAVSTNNQQIPTLITPIISTVAGDIVTVEISTTPNNVTIDSGAIFSNSII